ncbi:anti-sigma regulatory factor [Microtetraspora sp. NBRC 13810]|uniref:sensor histidine kinase n=1 Tax=Microtetraspora sp. NBRC 13810 TaxID=3030990 RepID=UPI0024A00265|nr:sensor histidine kinase [Microtetraspora sp. NBRC 13810]GLW06065.1 anti-sigma regulatory factor [Microtetraspora sp. NBRC 13810]
MRVQPERAFFDPESFAHVAAIYDSDQTYLHSVLPFVRRSLDHGRDTLVVAGRDKLGLLSAALGDDFGRIDRRIGPTWYTHPARTLTAYHEYAEPWARRGTTLIGEPVWAGRDERDVREWLRYESAINLAFAEAPVLVLCLYDRAATPADVLAETARTHPWCLDGDGLRPSADYVRPADYRPAGDGVPFADPPPRAAGMAFTSRDLARLRRTVADTAHAAGLDRDTAGSLVLSVSEIAANTVEHGAGHGRLTIWTAGRELICEITDESGRLDVPLPGYLPPGPASPRGYGLWISRQLCDLVEIRTEGGVLRVRLHMYLP